MRAGNGIRVLVVDHEPLVSEAVAALLESDGYIVRVVFTSEEALSEAGVFNPAVLVIDPLMPTLSGVDVAKRISRQIGCKVLFLTAQDNFKMTGCEVLLKPFNNENFLAIHRKLAGLPPIK